MDSLAECFSVGFSVYFSCGLLISFIDCVQGIKGILFYHSYGTKRSVQKLSCADSKWKKSVNWNH